MEIDKEVAAAFVAACTEVENVKRDTTGQVGNQKYKYATLEQVLAVVQPIEKKHSIKLTFGFDASPESDFVTAMLVHKSGATMDFGKYNLGQYGKAQDRGSALTYARRYITCAVYGITQEDDDGNAASQGTKESQVFPNAAKRKDWETKLSTLMGNATDVGELKAIWDEHWPVLSELKDSASDYENVAYEHLVKLKDQAKETILKYTSDDGILYV